MMSVMELCSVVFAMRKYLPSHVNNATSTTGVIGRRHAPTPLPRQGSKSTATLLQISSYLPCHL